MHTYIHISVGVVWRWHEVHYLTIGVDALSYYCTVQPSSAHLVKSKTPTSLTVLLDGQPGFVDGGTPSLRICMSEVLQTESVQHMSAADVASMCFTLSSPPKSARRNAGANALCV